MSERRKNRPCLVGYIDLNLPPLSLFFPPYRAPSWKRYQSRGTLPSALSAKDDAKVRNHVGNAGPMNGRSMATLYSVVVATVSVSIGAAPAAPSGAAAAALPSSGRGLGTRGR